MSETTEDWTNSHRARVEGFAVWNRDGLLRETEKHAEGYISSGVDPALVAAWVDAHRAVLDAWFALEMKRAATLPGVPHPNVPRPTEEPASTTPG